MLLFVKRIYFESGIRSDLGSNYQTSENPDFVRSGMGDSSRYLVNLGVIARGDDFVTPGHCCVDDSWSY